MSSRTAVVSVGRSLSMARSGRNRPSVGPSGRSHSAARRLVAELHATVGVEHHQGHRDGLGQRPTEGGIGQVHDRVRFSGPGRQRSRRGHEPRQLRIVGLVDHVDGEGAHALRRPDPVRQLAAPPGCRCQRRGSNAEQAGQIVRIDRGAGGRAAGSLPQYPHVGSEAIEHTAGAVEQLRPCR